MADLDYLRRKALAARQFDVSPEPGVSFTLRVPTKHESMVAYMEAAGGRKAANQVRWQRQLLLLAVVGWSGVVARHVLPGIEQGGDDPLAFEPGAAELLLDAQDAWAEQLLAELVQRLDTRQAAEDTAAKN